jgi:uncharacterized protein (DUF302 family)
MIDYGFVRELDLDFEAAVEAVKRQLQNEGFGVLMTIDLKQKFAEKLGIDFQKYTILGACDPVNACKAILCEKNVGLLLPCNVIVYERDGGATVAIVRPTVAMQMIENMDLHRIALDIERRLKAVLDGLQPAGAAV